MAKIQPIDSVSGESDSVAVVKPVVKSRLRRLFRISSGEKDELPPPRVAPMTVVSSAVVVTEEFEPSSVCLANMVKNYIEENNEKQVSSVRCGRNRCTCFVGGGGCGGCSHDGENDSVSPTVVCDYLKRLVVSTSSNEMNVLADTARVVAEKNKVCKRKDELRKVVVDGLMALGYDSSICKSKWEKSASFPAGEYEYVDVIVEGERLIIDIGFRSEFEVAKSTKLYKSILQTLPNIYVGKSDRLCKIVCIISEAAKQSLKKKGMHIPPWRKANYVQAKWLSPPTRLVANLNLTEIRQVGASHTNLSLSKTCEAGESKPVSNSSQLQTVSDTPECSDKILDTSDKNMKIVTGWASITKEKP